MAPRVIGCKTNGFSGLITSAPRSPRSIVANGPAQTTQRSMTRTPSSGFGFIEAPPRGWRARFRPGFGEDFRRVLAEERCGPAQLPAALLHDERPAGHLDLAHSGVFGLRPEAAVAEVRRR